MEQNRRSDAPIRQVEQYRKDRGVPSSDMRYYHYQNDEGDQVASYNSRGVHTPIQQNPDYVREKGGYTYNTLVNDRKSFTPRYSGKEAISQVEKRRGEMGSAPTPGKTIPSLHPIIHALNTILTDPRNQWMGMGMGPVAGSMKFGQQAVKYAPMLRSTGELPTAGNIIKYSGGMNLGGEGARATRTGTTSMSQLESQYARDPQAVSKEVDNLAKFPRVTSHEFMPPSMPSSKYVELSGGDIPDKAVMERAMNSGLRDQLLGFGQKENPRAQAARTRKSGDNSPYGK